MIKKARFLLESRFLCYLKIHLDFGNLFVLLPKSNYLCTELLVIVE